MQLMNASKIGPCIRLIGILFVSIGTLSARHQQPASNSEQYEFSAEDPRVHSPVKIPDPVLAKLSSDSTVRSVLAAEERTSLPQSWFSAARVHLGAAADREGLLVAGEPPLVGGNLTIFWVFLLNPTGYELALKVSAHDLAITKTFRAGYRVLEIQGLTASQIHRTFYQFDGKRYVPFREASKAIAPR